MLRIKEAEKTEIALLHSILVACGKKMYDQFSLSHWYPFMDLSTFECTMTDKVLYAVYQNSRAVATFNVSMVPRDYYYEELWSNPTEKALYFGQLGVDPECQQSGIGKWSMGQVEHLGYEMGCKAIRLDAVSEHPWLKVFYKNLGYQQCGMVTPKQWALTCFEKLLS